MLEEEPLEAELLLEEEPLEAELLLEEEPLEAELLLEEEPLEAELLLEEEPLEVFGFVGVTVFSGILISSADSVSSSASGETGGIFSFVGGGFLSTSRMSSKGFSETSKFGKEGF